MKKIIPLILIALTACTPQTTETKTTIEEVPYDFFLGSWALSLDYENNNAGWLDIRQEDNYLDASLLWRWASVYPVEFVYYDESKVHVKMGRNVSRKEEGSDTRVRMHHLQNSYTIQKAGEDSIVGIAKFPDISGIGVEKVAFTGKRIPPVGEAPDMDALKYGEPTTLFNGVDLAGWEMLDKGSVNGWKVIDGVLVNDPVQKEGEPPINYGNLRTIDTFNDFNLKLEVNVPEGSNSGVYLKGIYEIQVLDSYGKKLDSHNMGALYSRITPSESAEKPGGHWQQMDITLVDRHVTVILNGVNIIDNQPVKGVTGGAMTADEFIPGPIYLQGDHGEVAYRNIVLTPVE